MDAISQAKTKKQTINPGVPKSKAAIAPQAFSADPSKAQIHFDRLKGQAAWFREPSTGAEAVKPMLGILVDEDSLYSGQDSNMVLRKGGVLLKSGKKSFQAVQPEYFRSRFIRCFSDGTEICRLNESKMEQAVALSKSNTQMRKRIQELSSVGIWQASLKFLSISKNSKKMQDWNNEIQAHVGDLTLRHKMGIL